MIRLFAAILGSLDGPQLASPDLFTALCCSPVANTRTAVKTEAKKGQEEGKLVLYIPVKLPAFLILHLCKM